MLKIYHLHEKIVDYEEYIDKIIDSNFIKEKLENKIKELEKRTFKKNNCEECPLYFCSTNCDSDCNKCMDSRKNEIKNFCNSYEPFDDDETSCRNFNINTKDIYFYIEEKEIDITKEELLRILNNL